MKFGPVDIAASLGAILGHAVVADGRRYAKGHVLGAADLDRLRAAGIAEIFAGRLDADDVAEDAAAAHLAAQLAGPGTRAHAPFTGRANIYAEAAGLAMIDPPRIDAINAVDEAVTVATVAPFEAVTAGQMLATVKIIPFAVARRHLDAATAAAQGRHPAIGVAPYHPHQVGLIVTRLPATKASIVDKSVRAVSDRVNALGASVAETAVCAHDVAAIAAALAGQRAAGRSPLLIFGASAIVDRADIVPRAIAAAGGRIECFGMPVDPGNLLLLGALDGVPVVGVPGCARSAKLNGFDFVLRRLLAGLPLDRAAIARMGCGGLLKEIETRPQPREGRTAAAPHLPRIAAIVLAAGRSSRMGGPNKLLQPVDGKPMVAHIVDAALASAASAVVVVCGHQSDTVRAALAARKVTFVDSPAFAEGLSQSLKAGLAALPADIDGALVCLGDMPRLTAAHLDKLIAAFDPREGRAIIVPTRNGKRGNPVLWAAGYFPEIAAIAGDVGARHLIGTHAEAVREVPFEDDAVLIDVDTPAALAALERS